MGKFSIRNMSVKKKIICFSIVMLAFMVIIAAAGIVVATKINTERKARFDNYGEGEVLLNEAFSDFGQVRTRLRNLIYVYADEPEQYESVISNINRYSANTKAVLAAFSEKLGNFSPTISENYNKLSGYIDSYIESVDRAIKYVDDNNMEKARKELKEDGVVVSDNAEAALNSIIAELEKEADEEDDRIANEIESLYIFIIGLFVVSVIVAIAYSLTLIKAITVPVDKLIKAAEKLAKGDVDVDCKKINDDDLGELMVRFEEMASAIKEQVKVAEIIAKGDLTVNVEPRGPKDVLGKALHNLVKDDNETLVNIREASSQITVGSEQVANASQALAQGSTEQASSLEQITASVEDVTRHTKDNASEASEANNLVINVKGMAATGNEKMKAMIGAMNDINESSSTISKIIKTIDDIAFQTNILALNAAVEAARAGVHGKGFAVVAEEVRNLAAKSASAASETAEMIQDSINKVGNGTRLAEETAKSLDEIVKSIDNVADLINNITISSNNQATSISQIDQAISQVASVVHTNAATSEQCAAASEELSNQAVALKRLLSNYNLSSKKAGFDNNYSDVSESNFEDIISLDGGIDKY